MRVLCALILLLLTTVAHAARLELTGFESGDTSECQTQTGTFSVQSTTVYSGTYAFQANPTGTAIGSCTLTTINASGASVNGGGTIPLYVTFRWRAGTLPASGSEEIFAALALSASDKMFLRVTSAGKLQVYSSVNAQMGSDGTTTLVVDTWYLLQVKVGHGSPGPYEVRINGAVELSGTGNLNAANGHSQRVFGKATNRSGNTVNFYYDDIAVDDTDYPPGGPIVALHPDANGSTMQWTNGTGASNYTQVNEVVPSTTEYVQSVAQNDVALFHFGALPGTVGLPIAAVKVTQRVAENSSGGTTYTVRIRSGATNSDSTAADVGNTAYVTRQRLLGLDPATAAAWTVAGVNAVEAGATDASGIIRIRLAWLALMVEATTVTAAPTGRARLSVY